MEIPSVDVKANTAFRGFFKVAYVGSVRWLEIPAGTKGVLDDWDPDAERHKTVIFDLGKDIVSAPIDYNDHCKDATFVPCVILRPA